MDIIESLLALGSVMVDSMISTSETYSKDERFTPEGREYYKELNQALTMAKGNLKEYKQKRETSAFKKLQIADGENSRMATQRTSADLLKVYNLIEAYFGGYRGQDFEDKNQCLFHFLDKDCPINNAVLKYVKEPCTGQKFDVFPILALGRTANVWKPLSGTFKVNHYEFLVFCAEGIAFGTNPYHYVLPYTDIEKVYRYEKHTSGFFGVSISHLYFKPKNCSKETNMPRLRFPDALSESSKKLIANSMYNFIHCLNPNCTYEERKS